MTEDALRRLVDEADCRALLTGYGRAVDWKDRTALELTFWPDAEVDLGFYKGDGSGAPAFLIENAERSRRRCHITTNVNLRLEGDVAHAESCAITHAVSAAPAPATTSALFIGRYMDRLERRGGQWRIASRRYLLHGAHVAPYAEDTALEPLGKADDFGPEHPLFHPL